MPGCMPTKPKRGLGLIAMVIQASVGTLPKNSAAKFGLSQARIQLRQVLQILIDLLLKLCFNFFR